MSYNYPWRKNFEQKEIEEIDFCLRFESELDDHTLRTIVIKMAKMLNEIHHSSEGLQHANPEIAEIMGHNE